MNDNADEMYLLERFSDPVLLQALCDALAARGIDHRVEQAQVRQLLPVPGLTDARVIVAGRDLPAARQVLEDLRHLGETEAWDV